MEFKATRAQGTTIFHTKNESLLIDILIKSGVKNIQFITDASVTTTHLNKRITDDQVVKYRYHVSELMKSERQEKNISDLNIITGFSGCLITGIKLKYH